MYVLINHCWCRDSNWGGQYNCRVIVLLEQFATIEDVYSRKQTPDWSAIVEEHPHDNGREIPFKKYRTNRLKPEVMQWLKDNIKDRGLHKWEIERGEKPQGWAVGSDDYNATDSLEFTIFFERTSDAMKFIKRWSIYKKPTDYLNYFRNVRKKYDPKTKTLRRVERNS